MVEKGSSCEVSRSHSPWRTPGKDNNFSLTTSSLYKVKNIKFTQDFVEYRPLHIEDYLQESGAEHEGNAEVYRNLEMNERIDTNSKTMQGLFGEILTVQNLNDARRKV